jgi:glycosyltransferase involved in cell wall biosynthesis
MKVVFIARSTLFSEKGGDTFQVVQTAKHLEQQGIITDIKLTHEKIEYDRYDLMHFFNIIRPADILYHLKRCGKPFVLSTILIDYSEYDKYHRRGISGLLLRYLSSDNIEYIKTIARFMLGRDKLMTYSYLWQGQRNSINAVLAKASILFPNSTLEYKKMHALYKCSANCITIPNGVDPDLFLLNEKVKKDKFLVLCVARIEGIKNHLNLIRALSHTRFTLLIVGSPALNQRMYYRHCRKIAGPNVQFIEHLPQHELVQYYQKASVHVLPSWFETCGLSSLEAVVMGCNIVVSDKGYTQEYFENHAFYCDPGSPISIYNAVTKASKAGFPETLRKKILSSYTWQQAASGILKAYDQLSTHQ